MRHLRYCCSQLCACAVGWSVASRCVGQVDYERPPIDYLNARGPRSRRAVAGATRARRGPTRVCGRRGLPGECPAGLGGARVVPGSGVFENEFSAGEDFAAASAGTLLQRQCVRRLGAAR